MKRRLALAGGGVAVALLLTGSDSAPETAGRTAGPPPTASAGAASVKTGVREAAPASAPQRVILLGDSMIYASGLPDDEDFVSVISRDRPDLDVLNAAVPGNLTLDAIKRVRDVTDSHPATVVVWLGTNEALSGVPVETFASQLSTLLDRLAPAREVIVTPADNSREPGTSRPYAAAVRAIAGQRGCVLVDLEHVVTIGDLRDGLHLDAAAVVRVAHLIEQQIP